MTPEETVSFLLGRELLDTRDLADGNLSVSYARARSESLVIRCTTREGLFVKFPAGDADAERAFHDALAGSEALAPLRRFVSPSLHTGDAAGALAFTLLPSVADAPVDATALARALATCHHLEIRGANLPDAFPPALDIAFPGPSSFRTMSPVQLDVIRLVQGVDDLAPHVRERRASWQRTSLINGDVRAHHVLRVAASSPGDEDIRLLDWRRSGVGDPAWDVACALHLWMQQAMDTSTLDEVLQPPSTMHRLTEATAAVQATLQEFWDAYVATGGRPRGETDELLSRALSLLPLRVLASAWERAAASERLTPRILAEVQVAAHLVRRPATHTGALLGLPRGARTWAR